MSWDQFTLPDEPGGRFGIGWSAKDHQGLVLTTSPNLIWCQQRVRELAATHPGVHYFLVTLPRRGNAAKVADRPTTVFWN